MSDDTPEEAPDPDILPRYWGFHGRTVRVRYNEDLYSDKLRINVATPGSSRSTTAEPFGESHSTWYLLDIRF